MLSKSICHILVSVFISMGLTSCITYTYTETNYLLDDINQVASEVGYGSDKLPFEMRPSDMQAPAFNKKGQFYADGSITGNITSGQGYGAAYAITDNALLMARYSSYERKGPSEDDATYLEAYYTVTEFEVYNAAIVDETLIYAGDTSGMFEYTRTNQFDAKHGEIGYGRFKQFKNDLRNEWITGMGWGTVNTDYSLWLLGAPFNYSEKRKCYNLFVQDDFSWVKKHYQATAIGRFNTYIFKDRTLNMTGKYIEPEYRKSAFSLEGAMRISAGFSFAKVYLQYAGVLPIASKEIEWYNTELKAGLIIQIPTSPHQPAR